MFRAVLILSLAAASAAVARPKSKMIEFRSLPSSPKALVTALEKEKPGKWRDQLQWALETKLRDVGTDLTDPDAVDALTTQMFQAIFDDMAAPNDIWVWESGTSPRGDVLVRKTVLLLPGTNSSGYEHAFTVSPKGKRIDRGYLNTPCTVKVLVAKSPAEWHATVETKGWGAFLHGVKRLDGVVRVGVTLLSPGKESAATPTHERPVWVGFFTEGDKPGDFTLVNFEPARAKDQRYQESNLMPEKYGKWTEAQRRHVLAVRMEDVRTLNPGRTAFIAGEAKWFSLEGLSDSAVDAKSVKLLDPYRTSDAPLVRAAAVLKAAALGGEVAPKELVDVLTSVKVESVQRDASSQLEKLLGGSTEVVSAEDLDALKKAGGGDAVKVLKGVALVKGSAKVAFFTKGDAGWTQVTPKR